MPITTGPYQIVHDRKIPTLTNLNISQALTHIPNIETRN